MRKLLKAVVFLVILLLVLAAIAVVGVALFADRAAKAVVEKAGTKTLNVGVAVGKADASLLRGGLHLRNITVANPSGYAGPALLKLQWVNVKADPRSLLSEEVLIHDMELDAMDLYVEQSGLRNNLYEVIKPLREPHEPTGKRLVIDNLKITNVTVHVSLPAIPGQPQTAQFTLDTITMTELGRNEKMDTAVLISKIVLAIAAGVAERGGGVLPKETIGEISGILDKAIDIGRIIFGSGGKTPDGRQQDSLGKSVTDGIKDLLGGKKKQ